MILFIVLGLCLVLLLVYNHSYNNRCDDSFNDLNQSEITDNYDENLCKLYDRIVRIEFQLIEFNDLQNIGQFDYSDVIININNNHKLHLNQLYEYAEISDIKLFCQMRICKLDNIKLNHINNDLVANTVDDLIKEYNIKLTEISEQNKVKS